MVTWMLPINVWEGLFLLCVSVIRAQSIFFFLPRPCLITSNLAFYNDAEPLLAVQLGFRVSCGLVATMVNVERQKFRPSMVASLR